MKEIYIGDERIVNTINNIGRFSRLTRIAGRKKPFEKPKKLRHNRLFQLDYKLSKPCMDAPVRSFHKFQYVVGRRPSIAYAIIGCVHTYIGLLCILQCMWYLYMYMWLDMCIKLINSNVRPRPMCPNILKLNLSIYKRIYKHSLLSFTERMNQTRWEVGGLNLETTQIGMRRSLYYATVAGEAFIAPRSTIKENPDALTDAYKL